MTTKTETEICECGARDFPFVEHNSGCKKFKPVQSPRQNTESPISVGRSVEGSDNTPQTKSPINKDIRDYRKDVKSGKIKQEDYTAEISLSDKGKVFVDTSKKHYKVEEGILKPLEKETLSDKIDRFPKTNIFWVSIKDVRSAVKKILELLDRHKEETCDLMHIDDFKWIIKSEMGEELTK